MARRALLPLTQRPCIVCDPNICAQGVDNTLFSLVEGHVRFHPIPKTDHIERKAEWLKKQGKVPHRYGNKLSRRQRKRKYVSVVPLESEPLRQHAG